MEFQYSPELKKYMREKGKKNIVVEIAQSDSSDFEVTELHIHFISEKQTSFFLEKKRFIAKETTEGLVLLPPYRLEYDSTVHFDLKKILFIRYLVCEGIRL